MEIRHELHPAAELPRHRNEYRRIDVELRPYIAYVGFQLPFGLQSRVETSSV